MPIPRGRWKRQHLIDRAPINAKHPCRFAAAHTLNLYRITYATIQFQLLHPRPLQKQKAYHWRIFTPANNQTIWPLQWWIIAPAFSDENLATNLMYGAAVCRLCYYRQPEALPEAGDIEGQAAFWKQHYNTPFGAGTVSKYAYKVQKVLKEGVAH